MRLVNNLEWRPALLKCGLLVVIAGTLLVLLHSARVNAASIVVDENCSLVEAISSANTDSSIGDCDQGSGADTIILEPITYVYTAPISETILSALPYITSTITISGNGATIERDLSYSCPNALPGQFFTLLVVADTGDLTVDNVTLQNGCMEGGGAISSAGNLTIQNSRVVSNTGAFGGGVLAQSGTVTVTNSSFVSNTAILRGGGLYFTQGTVKDSIFYHNYAVQLGGAIYFNGSGDRNLLSNRIYENSAGTNGAALYLDTGVARMDNNLVAANQLLAPANGADIAIAGALQPATLLGRHNTLVAATPPQGAALLSGLVNADNQAFLTDTIISGYDLGLVALLDSTIVADGVLWDHTTVPTQTVTGQITVTNAYSGSAAFADPSAHDYHLTLASAALNRGVSNLPAADVDGDLRPTDVAADFGFDEFDQYVGITVTKSVGTDANHCAVTEELNVEANTPVYYCFTLHNGTPLTFTEHAFVDSLLGVQTPLTITLAPSQSVQITRSLISALGPYTVTVPVTNTVFVTSTTVKNEPQSAALRDTPISISIMSAGTAVVGIRPPVEPPVGDKNLYMPRLETHP